MRRLPLLPFALAIASVACGKTQADVARDAMMQVGGAQFYRDDMPAEENGPKVISATLTTKASAGITRLSFSGELGPSATAIAVALGGDVGYWILPAGIPDITTPTTPTFQGAYALAASAPPGPREIIFRAVDGAGHFGPPAIRPLEILAPQPPKGRLVLSLSWNNQADLDLHVLLPSGVEIEKRNTTEYERPPPSAGPVPPGAPIDGGILDRDSNGGCVFDGQRAENAIWTETPPKGHYIVRIDTFSLCGAPNSLWRASALLDGVRIAAAAGTSTENDLRFAHGRGAGVLAFELDVP